MEAIDYIQLFYTDKLFVEIVLCTNINAYKKTGRVSGYPWTDVVLVEIKAYYGLLLLMEVMTMDRDELYWSTTGHLVIKFGNIMPRDRDVQIKRYLHFSDNRAVTVSMMTMMEVID
jgi:hypothetical protein